MSSWDELVCVMDENSEGVLMCVCMCVCTDY